MLIANLILTIALLGFVVYLITLIPMPAPFQQVIYGLAILALIFIVIGAFTHRGGYLLTVF